MFSFYIISHLQKHHSHSSQNSCLLLPRFTTTNIWPHRFLIPESSDSTLLTSCPFIHKYVRAFGVMNCSSKHKLNIQTIRINKGILTTKKNNLCSLCTREEFTGLFVYCAAPRPSHSAWHTAGAQ